MIAIATFFCRIDYLNWEQSSARGIEQLSLRLRLVVLGTGLLFLLAALLALTAGKRQRR